MAGLIDVIKELWSPETLDPNRSYPNEPIPRGEEALQGSGFERYVTGGRLVPMEQIDYLNVFTPKNLKDVEGITQQWEFRSDIDQTLKEANDPSNPDKYEFIEDPLVGFNMGNAAIAIKRTAIAALGFDPDKTIFSKGNQLTAAGTTTTKEDAAGMFVSLQTDYPAASSTIVHEAIHNGLKKLRKIDVDTKVGNLSFASEEDLARAMMYKYYGDVETQHMQYFAKSLGLSQEELEKTSGWRQIKRGEELYKNNANLRLKINELEKLAAEEIKKQNPRGPR